MATKKASKKTFEDSFKELEEITESLESGEVDIEVSLKKFDKGLKIAKELEERLKSIQKKVKVIKSEE